MFYLRVMFLTTRKPSPSGRHSAFTESSLSFCPPHTAARAHITSASELSRRLSYCPLRPLLNRSQGTNSDGTLTELCLFSQTDAVLLLLHSVQISYFVTQMTTATLTPPRHHPTVPHPPPADTRSKVRHTCTHDTDAHRMKSVRNQTLKSPPDVCIPGGEGWETFVWRSCSPSSHIRAV